MKKIPLLFLLFFNIIAHSQDSKNEFNREFVIFEGCDNAEDQDKCFHNKLQDFILKNLDETSIKKAITESKKDTLTITARLTFDNNGKVILKKFSGLTSIKPLMDNLKSILKIIPKVKPQLDKYNNPVSSSKYEILGFQINRKDKTLIPLYDYIPLELPFIVIERVPVYKGCDKKLSNEVLKKCMSNGITKHIIKKFNTNSALSIGLPNGLVRIYVSFKIDKKGRVVNVKAKGPKPQLEKEAIRVVKLIPRLSQPGYHKGKPVVVFYALPIIFKIDNPTPKSKKR